jgi:hypothetical protein
MTVAGPKTKGTPNFTHGGGPGVNAGDGVGSAQPPGVTVSAPQARRALSCGAGSSPQLKQVRFGGCISRTETVV